MMGFGLTGHLFALGVGAAFLIWSERNKGKGVKLAKITGYVIVGIAALAILCGGIKAIKYWKKGSPMHPHEYGKIWKKR